MSIRNVQRVAASGSTAITSLLEQTIQFRGLGVVDWTITGDLPAVPAERVSD